MFPVEYFRKYQIYVCIPIKARFGDIIGLVSDHHNKTNITIKQLTEIFVSQCT